jgi:glycosyltransferase involved in cell wall biosynthesis
MINVAYNSEGNDLKFPLISVLIPAYNHEKFVRACLDSVIEDSYPNKEIVIINDGSSDMTGAVISEWMEKNSKKIAINYLARENRGLTYTLNELAKRSKGEFLRLGASDDYFIAGGLATQVSYLLANPGKMAVIGDSIVVDEDNQILYESGMIGLHKVNKKNYLSDQGISEEIICRWAVGGPVPMIRKKAIESLFGWSEGLRIDDWDLFLRLISNNSLGFVDCTVGAYRIHGSNTCRTPDLQTRISNLSESKIVASKYTDLFDQPFKSMLKAQIFLIGAKISFLKKNPVLLCLNMLGFISWMTLSKVIKSLLLSRSCR